MSTPDAPPPTQPPFPLSRETRIRIDRDGRFFHEDDPITHDTLTRALASWVDVDPDTGRYILRNSVNWAYVTVEDAPLVVHSLTATPDGDVLLALSDGTTEALDPNTLRLDADDVPYCDVRRGALPARFTRPARFALLDLARVDDAGRTFVRTRAGELEVPRVPRGEGARRRRP
jgi:hypothetical protein